jgi:hypothetical protein
MLCHNRTVAIVSLSNHSGVPVTLNLKKRRKSHAKREVFNFNRANWRGMNEELAALDWEVVMQEPDIDAMVVKWTEEYTKIIERHIPKRTIRVEDGNKLWKTEKIENLIIKKKKGLQKNENYQYHKTCSKVQQNQKQVKKSYHKRKENTRRKPKQKDT